MLFHAGDSEGNESNLIYEYKPNALRARFFGIFLLTVAIVNLPNITSLTGGISKSGEKGKKKKKGSTNSFSDSDDDSLQELGDDPQQKYLDPPVLLC